MGIKSYRHRWIKVGVAVLTLFFVGAPLVIAQKKQVDHWRQALQQLHSSRDKELMDNRDGVVAIRNRIERWIKLHPTAHIVLPSAPPEPWGVAEMRMQVASLHSVVEAMLQQDLSQPFEMETITIHIEGKFKDKDFVGPMFTETNTKTRMTENAIHTLGPASTMSILRAISLIPSVNQQSVDPAGLADSSNYHESFRFRGVEATAGGNPSTPVNVENIPVSGRPGGGANIYDLENFRNLSIYKGGVPADKTFGLTNIGGKIDLEVKRPDERFRLELKQALGSYDFRRSFLRISTGLSPSKTSGFLSYSNTHADKWKGEGGADRNNVMIGLTQAIGDKLKIEAFSIYNHAVGNAYRPLNYEKVSSLSRNYNFEYSNDKFDYQYYGYNKSSFKDYNIFANIEYKPDADSSVTVKPFYWRDKGYYQETITTNDGSNRIRKWNIDHAIRGVVAQYSRKIQTADFNIGYSYLNQERPGPPSSWKLYKVSPTGLVFDKWQILSNSSKHRQDTPFVSGRYSIGSWTMEGGVKYMRYSMPEITTYNATGISDIGYKEALERAPSSEANASALAKTFNKVLPNFGLSYLLNKSLSSYFSYGRNHGMSVSLYPFFISQKGSFYAKGITLQNLWDEQKIEIADNYDAGLRYITSKLYIVPTVYFARHKNKAATYYDASLKATFPSSVFNADAYGAELEAGAVPMKRLSLYSSFSYNRFYFSQNIHNQAGSIIDVQGNQAPDAPEYLAKGIVSYSIGGFIFSPTVRYTSSRYGDILQKEKIDGAAIVDFGFSYAAAIPQIMVKKIDIALAFNNIFDKKYISIINTSDYTTLGSTYQAGAPLTVHASVSISF